MWTQIISQFIICRVDTFEAALIVLLDQLICEWQVQSISHRTTNHSADYCAASIRYVAGLFWKLKSACQNCILRNTKCFPEWQAVYKSNLGPWIPQQLILKAPNHNVARLFRNYGIPVSIVWLEMQKTFWNAATFEARSVCESKCQTEFTPDSVQEDSCISLKKKKNKKTSPCMASSVVWKWLRLMFVREK